MQGTDQQRLGRRRKTYELTAGGTAQLEASLFSVNSTNLQPS
jgi:DNA-binding PadR family transcriptional regulator